MRWMLFGVITSLFGFYCFVRLFQPSAFIHVGDNTVALATVFIEYPSKGIWSLGFITNNNVHCLTDDNGQHIFEKTVSVFIPSTPNPMNGIFVFVGASQVQYSSMSVEEGVKCLMSAGMIVPEGGMGS